MENKFTPKPNTGNLFKVDKKSEDSPNLRGDLFVEVGLLKLLIDKHTNADGLVQIAVGGWTNVSKRTGNKYIGLRVSEPYIAKPKPEPKPVEDYSQDDEDVPF